MARLLEKRIHCLVYIHCREMSVVRFASLPSHVLLQCKMATLQQKSFCVIEFAKFNSVIRVQRLFRLRYQIDAPNGWDIRRLYRQFVDRGCVCKGKSPGRRQLTVRSILLCYKTGCFRGCTRTSSFRNKMGHPLTGVAKCVNIWMKIYQSVGLDVTDLRTYTSQQASTVLTPCDSFCGFR